MNRRGFLGSLAGFVAGAALDPDKLPWVQGTRTISIPATRTTALLEAFDQTAFPVYRSCGGPIEALRFYLAHYTDGRYIATESRDVSLSLCKDPWNLPPEFRNLPVVPMDKFSEPANW